MLFNPKNKKVLQVLTAVFSVIVILGMLLLYFPAILTMM